MKFHFPAGVSEKKKSNFHLSAQVLSNTLRALLRRRGVKRTFPYFHGVIFAVHRVPVQQENTAAVSLLSVSSPACPALCPEEPKLSAPSEGHSHQGWSPSLPSAAIIIANNPSDEATSP